MSDKVDLSANTHAASQRIKEVVNDCIDFALDKLQEEGLPSDPLLIWQTAGDALLRRWQQMELAAFPSEESRPKLCSIEAHEQRHSKPVEEPEADEAPITVGG